MKLLAISLIIRKFYKFKFLFYFLLFFSFSTHSNSNCDFITGQYISELSNPYFIESIDVLPKNKIKFHKNLLNAYLEKTYFILNKYKKKFKANILVKYKFGKCNFPATIRLRGDLKDHIPKLKGKISSSINIQLKEGNILNATSFKLMIPKSRNGFNEILGTLILKELGFIVPETFAVRTIINDTKQEMIFQENPRKEMLERNKRREGPIFEGDDDIIMSFMVPMDYQKDYLYNDKAKIALTRLINNNWFLKGDSSQFISLKSYELLQKRYLKLRNTSKVSMSEGFSIRDKDIFNKYEGALLIMNGWHGFELNNRQYYYNVFKNSFEPIYYDANLYFNKKILWTKEIINDLNKKGLNLNNLKYDFTEIINKNKKKIYKNFKDRVKLNTNFDNINFVSEKDILHFFNESITVMLQNNQILINYKNQINDISIKNTKLSDDVDVFIKNNKKLNVENSIIISLDKKEKYHLKTYKNGEIILNHKDLARIISRNTHKNERYIYLNDSNIAKSFNVGKVNYLKKNNIEIIYSENLKIEFEDNLKEISFKQSDKSDWVLIKSSKLDGWKVNFEGTKQSNNSYQENNQRFNYHGMTGCLNFYDIEFKNTTVNSKFSNCEDGVNIVNSNGFIQRIEINDSDFDALDLDFSKIEINEIKITNAGNDCIDVSGGEYFFNIINIAHCQDKGISVGESSIFIANDVYLNNSNIGMASKDSSKTEINFAKFINVNFCHDTYKKKQEFNGSYLKIDYLNCNSNIRKDIHSISKIVTNEF